MKNPMLSKKGEEKALLYYWQMQALGQDIELKSLLEAVLQFAISFKRWDLIYKEIT